MDTVYIVVFLYLIFFGSALIALGVYADDTDDTPELHPRGVRCRNSALPKDYWCADCCL